MDAPLPIRRAARMIALLLATTPLAACNVEQILIGQFYSIATPPDGSCPTLRWQFVVNAQRSIDGSLLDAGQRQIATLSGTLRPDDSFVIHALPPTGAASTTVTGQFSSGVSTISINGNAAGPGCDGKTFTLHLGGYFARSGGGGGGGG